MSQLAPKDGRFTPTLSHSLQSKIVILSMPMHFMSSIFLFLFSLIMVAWDMVCFVVGNKGSARVKNLSEKESVKQTAFHARSVDCNLLLLQKQACIP